MNPTCRIKVCILMVCAVHAVLECAQRANGETGKPVSSARLSFFPNHGQWHEPTRFGAFTSDATILFAPDRVIFGLIDRGTAPNSSPESAGRETLIVTTRFVGADDAAGVEGEAPLEHVGNFCLGNDPSQWVTGVHGFGAVRYRSVYPGIDVRYSGDGRELKYDFFIAPGFDYRAIRVAYDGVEELTVTNTGDLKVTTRRGTIVEKAPFVYQRVDGQKRAIEARYVLLDECTFGFEIVGSYDPLEELVIDPVLTYSTYLGGVTYDQVGAIKSDAAGSAYVVGGTLSLDFPTTVGPLQGGNYDAFVTKFLPDGSGLVYSTFIGGDESDIGYGIEVDAAGVVYLSGTTGSSNFPTFPANAYDTTFNGANPGEGDMFVTRLDAAGGITYSTYLGGTVFSDIAQRITIDAAGRAYVVGYTAASDYPTTAGAYDTSFNGVNDVVVSVLEMNGAGSADLVYSTFLGGSEYEEAYGIALDAAGDIYISGSTRSSDFPGTGGPPFNGTFDAFVAKISPDGAGLADLIYNRLLGGSNHDYGLSVDVDVAGQAHVAGVTKSANFPTTTGVMQPAPLGGSSEGFVAKLDAPGTGLIYSTYLGGSKSDRAHDISLDAAGHAYVTGSTDSIDFPVSANAFDQTQNGGLDAFVTALETNGSAVIYSTYLGGSSNDLGYGVHVGPTGCWYMTGTTQSLNYPTTTGVFDTVFNGGPIDVVVTKGPLFCPLTAPMGTFDPCTALQATDCIIDTPTGESCRALIVEVVMGFPVALLCDCINPGEKCGPIDIQGTTIICPGACPDPNPPGECFIHVDGVSIGRSIADTSDTDIIEFVPIDCRCVTPEPTGACCFDADGIGIRESCAQKTQDECDQLFGIYHGDNTLCGLTGACCYDADGDGVAESCEIMDSTCCEDLLGTFQGPGTLCQGDNDGNGIDDGCDCTLNDIVQTFDLRSGNGLIGGPDSQISFISGAPGAPLSPVPFTTADFDNACSFAPAPIVPPVSAWLPGSFGDLPSDPFAQWLGKNQSRSPASALFCYEFEVCCPNASIVNSFIGFKFAADDRLGDPTGGPNIEGVYINQVPLVGFSGGDFTTETTFFTGPLPLATGTNTLHVYLRDTLEVVSGLIFAARISIDCATEACCFADGSCQNLNPCCCEDAGGTPQGFGTACQGDGDGNGVDDACDPPLTPCPMDPLCFNFPFDCQTSLPPGEECRPKTVIIGLALPKPSECACFGDTCGPVTITQIPPDVVILSCEEVCPDPPGGECVIHYDGVSTGLMSVVASDVPADVMGITCACAVDCCLPDGSCISTSSDHCLSLGGTEVPMCMGDHNGNNIDDACDVDCCFVPPGNCTTVPDFQCEPAGGFIVPGCLGDNDGNGVDDACELPPPMCAIDEFCAFLQDDCDSSAPTDQECRPSAVHIGAAGPEATECACFDDVCGPVTIVDDGTGVFGISCEEVCPNPPGGECVIHYDGVSTGQTIVSAGDVPADVIDITCACAIDCCLPDGSCISTSSVECLLLSGTEVPACLGDTNGNNIDDACDVDCCFPDGSCATVADIVCESAGGVVVPGCLGDANNNGIDDACEPPPPMCAIDEFCAFLQDDCDSSAPANQVCRPSVVEIGPAGPVAQECACFDDICGPVTIAELVPGEFEISCEEVCPNPPGGECLIHYDGVSSGHTSVSAADVPPGVDDITCACTVDCCLPDGSCISTSPDDCLLFGGTQVPACLGDTNGNNIDDACDVDCCFPDGSCSTVADIVCESAGGIVVPGCLGDANNNGIDDACEQLVCPLPPPPLNMCIDHQQFDCGTAGPADGECLPKVMVVLFGGFAKLVECDCCEPGCCAIHVDGLSDLSCPDVVCPAPDEFCQIHFNGVATGLTAIDSLDYPQGGFYVSCDCAPSPELGACCFDADGDGIDESCAVMTADECDDKGGTFHGVGTICGQTGACCIDADGDGTNETCHVMDSTCCQDIGGSFQGAGTSCLGDNNNNGFDDACDCEITTQTYLLRSGNGTIGNPDSIITFLGGLPTAPLSSTPFNDAHFYHACHLTPAEVVNPYPPYLPGSGGVLPSDPGAQWIAATQGLAAKSALYCYEFDVCCPDASMVAATIDFAFAADDQLGDNPLGPNNVGVYINEIPVPGYFGVGFGTETILPTAPISLVQGTNTMHVYLRDTFAVVAGIVFSASIDVDCAVEACCFDDGTCQDLDPCCCEEMGGTPQGLGTDCASTDCLVPECQTNAIGTECIGSCTAPEECAPLSILTDLNGNFLQIGCCDCQPADCRLEFNPVTLQMSCVNPCPPQDGQCTLVGKGNIDGTISWGCECIDPFIPQTCEPISECDPCIGGQCTNHCTGPCPNDGEVCLPTVITETSQGSGQFSITDCDCDPPGPGDCRPVVNGLMVECVTKCIDGINCLPPTVTVNADQTVDYECPPCTGFPPCVSAADCLDADSCTCDTCEAGLCVHTPSTYGDVTCDPGGIVDLDDILCVIAGFANAADCPNADVAPCGGNGLTDLDDILAVIGAFGGKDLCGCGG